MIDKAAADMENGAHVAGEHISGINDNMYISHYHTYYELYYLEAGERYHLIGDGLHHVTARQFLIFEPFILHRSYGDADIPFSRILLYFRKEMIDSARILQDLAGITGVYRFGAAETSRIYQMMQSILKEQEKPGSYQEEYLRNMIQLLLIILLKNKNAKSTEKEKSWVTDVIRYINQNYSRKITLEELTSRFYISKEHLCRKFKEHTNMTIVHYVNSVRVMNAQKLLHESKKSISEISMEAGFENITHFERVFKAMNGKTPSAYRKEGNVTI